MPVVGHRTLLRLQTSRSTTPSIEQGDTEHSVNKRGVNPSAGGDHPLVFAKEFRLAQARWATRKRRKSTLTPDPIIATGMKLAARPGQLAESKVRYKNRAREAAPWLSLRLLQFGTKHEHVSSETTVR